MQTTNTLLSKSRLQMEFELPPERLVRSLDDATRRLSQQHRFPGFRPGKAPRSMVERVLGHQAVLDEAVDLLVDASVREAVREQDIAALDSPEVDVTQAEEGKPFIFKVIVPVRPEVKLGDFEGFKFKPEVSKVDDATVDKVVDELRDSAAHLEPADDRGAQKGDYAIIGFQGTRDGVPFDGGSSDRMPLVLGQDRLIPGFEDHLLGLMKGDETEFDIVFPDDYQEESLRSQTAHFVVTLQDLRAKVLPEANDEFARSVGKFEDMDGLRAELRRRLEANALDRARHDFADKIIEYASGNATVDLPDILVDQEVEVMHDELRSALARQGISEEAYVKVTGKTEEAIEAEFRPRAEQRVKTLLVVSEIAKAKGVEVPDHLVEAEVAKARSRYADNKSLLGYFESERGRSYIRSTIRRSRTIELLVDEWLAAHPEAPRIQHLEDIEESSAVDSSSAEAVASIGVTDPGKVMPPAADNTGD
jgi:trigger factor